MGTPRRVLLVEDDARYIEALRLVVDPQIELTVCRSVAEVETARGPWDAACVDLGLPDGDGADVVRALSERHPEMPVIVVTVQRADRRIIAAVRAGARGYLLKEHAGARLESAIEEAIAGGAPVSPSVARRLLTLIAALPAAPQRERPEPRLTERELAVLRAFSEGQTYQQAAASLGISLNTLRSHVRSAYEKLAVGTRTEAVLSALELGLLAKH